ncbi:PREDICTED: rap guanine nucleotide exchange factor 3 [Corvus brachyrhynchos]|uniref:rap guanine nucleotide exchange factor 3 n=1 Tax=Corvus brachyrhynchos TaxID=85066 RepID=UPI000816657A|nr:PREDICTED: rap guanine nucleotide exchange factor 3 [Corvus brachyrhynchos]
MFEGHQRAGTVLFSQGDKGTSWYIIWKGSVNVVTHGKGLVATLHEGDDFGQLALVNDAPRAATILLREDNCHFLRVDKQDFNRILKGRGAGTPARAVTGAWRGGPARGATSAPPVPTRYLVMAGTPEKILEHLLEFMRLDATLYDPVDTLLGDFLLTYTVFMPTSQLCRALLHHFRAEPLEGSEQDKATYSLRKRRKILRLVSQPPAGGVVAGAASSPLTCLSKARSSGMWPGSPEEAILDSTCTLRAQDKVPYEIFRADHSCLVSVLPVNASVRDVLRALAPRLGQDREHVLVKVNSAGDRAVLPPDAVGVFTALGLNERLFVVSRDELGSLPAPLRPQDPSWNHRVYRLAVAKMSPPIIPFVPLLLKDMTFIHEGNRTLAENLINFEKMHMMAKTVRVLQRCRGHAHAPLSPLRNRSPHRPEDTKAVRISTCSEQSLSVRNPVSTWAYLQHLRARDSQKELLRLSRDLEP